MYDYLDFYIDGQWVDASGQRTIDVINPATETIVGRVSMGEQEDVDRAVAAARRAFPAYSTSSRESRIALLERIAAEFATRWKDLGSAMTAEMGSPEWLIEEAQLPLPRDHINTAIEALKNYVFQEQRGVTRICREPIGVCGLITPWNWPVSTVITKVIPALAVGCTVVLKPSEYSPLSAHILAEVFDAAKVPPGVFNLVNGDGPTVGAALSAHPLIDMVSITGSTRAGVEVARNAAATIKRVHQELGGKSPNIMLKGADLKKAIKSGVDYMLLNSGQTCSAPSRMLVPSSLMDEALVIAKSAVEEKTVGSPESGNFVGPVVNVNQWNRIQKLINAGIAEGATLLCGGPGKPVGLEQGYYVKPTIFTNVTSDMSIVKEEIFGPVLVIQSYDDVEDAIRMANDTPYGLAAYVHGKTVDDAAVVGARIHAGQVYLNGDLDIFDTNAPFGGFKQSGNGREWGAAGLEAFLETKAMLGFPDTNKVA